MFRYIDNISSWCNTSRVRECRFIWRTIFLSFSIVWSNYWPKSFVRNIQLIHTMFCIICYIYSISGFTNSKRKSDTKISVLEWIFYFDLVINSQKLNTYSIISQMAWNTSQCIWCKLKTANWPFNFICDNLSYYWQDCEVFWYFSETNAAVFGVGNKSTHTANGLKLKSFPWIVSLIMWRTVFGRLHSWPTFAITLMLQKPEYRTINLQSSSQRAGPPISFHFAWSHLTLFGASGTLSSSSAAICDSTVRFRGSSVCR